MNRLTILESKIKKIGRNLYSKYICSCGNERYYQERQVNIGRIKSCGCLKKERISKLKFKDGLKAENLKLYQVWASMRKRCVNEKDTGFSKYGARGISVCNDWNTSFKSFYIWSINNGYNIGLSIDRINNDGNYEPENCRWTTCSVQAKNTRRSLGENKAQLVKNDLKLNNCTMLEIAKKYNTSLSTIKRIKYGKTY
jgi:hypothetical protein